MSYLEAMSKTNNNSVIGCYTTGVTFGIIDLHFHPSFANDVWASCEDLWSHLMHPTVAVSTGARYSLMIFTQIGFMIASWWGPFIFVPCRDKGLKLALKNIVPDHCEMRSRLAGSGFCQSGFRVFWSKTCSGFWALEWFLLFIQDLPPFVSLWGLKGHLCQICHSHLTQPHVGVKANNLQFRAH